MPVSNLHKLKIACIGEAMLEMAEDPDEPGHLVRHAGGDSLFTAVYLARLLKDRAQVSFVTQLGEGPQTSAMIREWQAMGLSTDMVWQVAGGVTGRYAVELDEDGSRYHVYWRKDSPFRSLFQTIETSLWLEKLSGFDLLYFSGATLASLDPVGREILLHLSRAVHEQGGRVAFDGSFRPEFWGDSDQAADWVGRAYKEADIALPTYDDASDLAVLESGGVMLNRFLMMGCNEVVIKMDDEPYFVACDGERHVVEAASRLDVTPNSVSGDSFNAGYLAARLSGCGGREAVLLGHRIADRVKYGGGIILPPGEIGDLRPRPLS